MLPTVCVVGTQHELLRERIHLLALLEAQVVGCHIVLVHQHLVVQELIAGGGGEEQLLRLVADGDTRIEHIALITVHDGGGRVHHIREFRKRI